MCTTYPRLFASNHCPLARSRILDATCLNCWPVIENGAKQMKPQRPLLWITSLARWRTYKDYTNDDQCTWISLFESCYNNLCSLSTLSNDTPSLNVPFACHIARLSFSPGYHTCHLHVVRGKFGSLQINSGARKQRTHALEQGHAIFPLYLRITADVAPIA
jgi:hypothetical protein